MIPVEKGIPIPTPRKNCGNHKYPWESMLIGDSFFVKREDPKTMNYLQNQLAQRSREIAKKLGHEYVTRRMGDGVRVWRVA